MSKLEKEIIKRTIPFIKFLDLILPKKKKKVVFCITYNQLSACSVFLDYLRKNYGDKYKFVIIIDKVSRKLSYKKMYSARSIKGVWNALTAKYVIMSNCTYIIDIFRSKRHIYLNLWHGMPIKKIGYTTQQFSTKEACERYSFLGENANFFVTSDFYRLVIGTAFRAKYNNIHITGNARNDLIGKTDNDKKIRKRFKLDNFSKVVFYMPTFKITKTNQQEVQNDFKNVLSLNGYNEKDFINLLEENNILFLMKPHPTAEFFWKEHEDILPKSPNFRIVYNSDFVNHNIQLYETFKFVDVMISDYSSVVSDYLILNRPIICIDDAENNYQEKYGMILEDNYREILPGTKVSDYTNFRAKLLDGIKFDSYKSEREKILPLIHKYADFDSCRRIYEVMEKLQ